MKRIYVYLLGVLTGVVLFFVISIVVSLVKGTTGQPLLPQTTMFETSGEIIPATNFEVIQSLPDGTAIAKTDDALNSLLKGNYNSKDITVLLGNDGSFSYFDGKHISIPEGYVARQVGTFRYMDNYGDWNTIPIVWFYLK